MLWVKRLCDHVIQDLLGHPDLEFAWGDIRPTDPAEQAKVIDIYVRDGIYAVNEARELLGLDPVPGGDQPMIYGTQGAQPLGKSAAKPAGAASLRKYNPDEPRVPAGSPDGGQWTDGGSQAIRPVQELIPFGARPPLVFEEPPNEVFKEPIPRLSGREGAKDVPDWARGNRPYVGERGRDFAKRLMDEKYGRDNWNPTEREYRQIQKWGDRAFRDPRSILSPDDDHI
jgi:hypothetical protein